jgi:uncharacterized RDD family membrane protein YckC
VTDQEWTGQQPAYPPGYQQLPGYGQQYGPPPLPDGVRLASWGARAGAYVIDVSMLFACFLPGLATTIAVTAPLDTGEDPNPVGIAAIVVIFVGGLLTWLYQYTWRQGSRGQSWGKQLVGIDLVREYDFRPPGGGIGIGRYALRMAIGNATCGAYSVVTLLWPLWDERNQTLDDKMLHTLVVRLPR